MLNLLPRAAVAAPCLLLTFACGAADDLAQATETQTKGQVLFEVDTNYLSEDLADYGCGLGCPDLSVDPPKLVMPEPQRWSLAAWGSAKLEYWDNGVIAASYDISSEMQALYEDDPAILYAPPIPADFDDSMGVWLTIDEGAIEFPVNY